MLQPKQNQDKCARTPLVVTYHPTLLSFPATTKHHLLIHHAFEWLQRAFLLPPVIAYCHPRNLKDFLVCERFPGSGRCDLYPTQAARQPSMQSWQV